MPASPVGGPLARVEEDDIGALDECALYVAPHEESRRRWLAGVGALARSWWLFLVGGVLSILAGVIAFAWPGRTLLVVSVLLAWFLVFKGIVDAISALANTHRDWWWVTLLLGFLEFLLGIWAVGYPGRALFVFVNLVGIYAILYGFTEIFAGFALRELTHGPRRRRPAV